MLLESGKSSNFDDNSLKSLVESDPKLTTDEISQKFHYSWSTVQEHLNALAKQIEWEFGRHMNCQTIIRNREKHSANLC
uniref:HTH luxR-type domain-containing protein n=1 Tax=Heterorhabditis bacteriophora TaxID=37862 RepID=A0A1I7X285_HETBA